MTPETIFKNRVTKWFKDQQNAGQKLKFHKIGAGGFQKAGIPDIIACVNGVYFEIELKSARGTPTDLQKYEIRKTNQANGFGLVVYPDGFEDLKTIIKEVMRCNTLTAEWNAIKSVHTNSKCDTLTN